MAAVALLGAGPVYAQSSLALTNWSVDGGGGASSGSGYTINAASGQPDAGQMGGGNFNVVGGFWSSDGAAVAPTPSKVKIYLPIVWSKSVSSNHRSVSQPDAI
jgi:hypothetical protein